MVLIYATGIPFPKVQWTPPQRDALGIGGFLRGGVGLENYQNQE